MRKYEYDEIRKLLYTSTKKIPFLVNVPTMNYITYPGSGHPGEADFQEACNTLYTLSYLLKFRIARAEKEIDYKVNPLEVSWYLTKQEEGIKFTWKAMIMQPDFITIQDYNKALCLSMEQDKDISYDKAQFETINFGQCVQCFHPGDYNNMNDTMYRMQDLAKEHQLNYDLYTHDIYLNDSRKTKVENLKTIMRIGVYEKQKVEYL